MAWIEQTAERTRKAKIFQDDANPGLRRFVAGIADQHYHDGSAWQDIDEALVDDGLDGFAHKCEKVRHIIRMGATGTRRWYPRRDHPNEYVTFGRLQSWSGTAWANVNLGTPTRSGNTITWDTANFRLTITNTWHRIKILAVLKTEAARRRLRWQVSLTGLTWDSWQLRGVDDVIVGTIDKPIAWDANGSIDEPNVTITTSYSGGYVEFGGNLAGATLPITIDPTFTDGYGGDVETAYDNCLRSDDATSNYGTWETHEFTNTVFRALSKFTLTALEGATINSATLTLRVLTGLSWSSPVTGSWHRILAANSSWTETGSCWNYRVGTTAWAGSGGCSTSGTDYSSTALASITLDDTTWGAGAHNIALNATEFAAMVAANYGIVAFSQTASEQTTVATSDHATTSYRPKLVVDYTAAAAGGNPYYAFAQQM